MELKDKQNLERLLGKLINRRSYECPDCNEKPHWTLMPAVSYENENFLIYCCSDCKNDFQYLELYIYNAGGNNES